MTLRAALYARYSSDQQRAASIEDHFRVCREHAGREAWKIASTYHDAAISGGSVTLRPGIQGLLEDARRGMFEIVVAEALDRVSRDQADVATLYKHLRYTRNCHEAADAIRRLIERIVLTLGEKRGEIHATLHGDLGAILDWASGGSRGKETPGTPQDGMSVSVVAGTRRHHLHSRLAPALPPPASGSAQRSRVTFSACAASGSIRQPARALPTDPDGPASQP